VAVLAKYLLLQLPGWGAAALILWALVEWMGLPAWVAVLLLGADVAKDLVLFPFLRHAYGNEPSKLIGPETLLGARAIVEDELTPLGWVRVRGERWRAEARAGAPLGRGLSVVVRGVRGLRLEVEAEDAGAQQSADT